MAPRHSPSSEKLNQGSVVTQLKGLEHRCQRTLLWSSLTRQKRKKEKRPALPWTPPSAMDRPVQTSCPAPPRPVRSPAPLGRRAGTRPGLFLRGRAWPAVLSPQSDQVCLPGTVWLFLVFVERMRRRRRENSDRFRGQATKAPPQSSWTSGLRGGARPSWSVWCEGPHRSCPWELELMAGTGVVVE